MAWYANLHYGVVLVLVGDWYANSHYGVVLVIVGGWDSINSFVDQINGVFSLFLGGSIQRTVVVYLKVLEMLNILVSNVDENTKRY